MGGDLLTVGTRVVVEWTPGDRNRRPCSGTVGTIVLVEDRDWGVPYEVAFEGRSSLWMDPANFVVIAKP